MTFPPYPLAWPEALPRTERKASSQFRTSMSAAINNVKKSIMAFGNDTGKPIAHVSVTTNGGMIEFGEIKDTGVAIWFEWDRAQRCIAVDRYAKMECNLQAIHHIIEARRAEMRHGGLHIVRQTFKGFVALPAPDGAKSWRETLSLVGVTGLTAEAIGAAYRAKAKAAHPDAGGSAEAMDLLTRARDEGLASLK